MACLDAVGRPMCDSIYLIAVFICEKNLPCGSLLLTSQYSLLFCAIFSHQ